MFCENCGTQVDDGVKFCPNCGTPMKNSGEVQGFVYNENTPVTPSPVPEFNGNTNSFSAGPQAFMPLRTDRILLIFVLFSLITCGIYMYIFLYYMIKDVNTACAGDGDETPGLLLYVLLSLVTCGIYSYIWVYKLGDRLARNCQRYGYTVTENGTTVLLWFLFGALLCGVGPFIGWNILINNTNMVCAGYNREHGVA